MIFRWMSANWQWRIQEFPLGVRTSNLYEVHREPKHEISKLKSYISAYGGPLQAKVKTYIYTTITLHFRLLLPAGLPFVNSVSVSVSSRLEFRDETRPRLVRPMTRRGRDISSRLETISCRVSSRLVQDQIFT